MKIRIATRKSPLALWQANFVKAQLIKLHPKLIIDLVPLVTAGDRNLTERLDKVGGKGLFVKELEMALLSKQADLAVHSMKDVPHEFPAQLHIAVIMEREDHRDVLLSRNGQKFADLNSNATLGTSSLRRQSQLYALRSDVQINLLRGNVDTRVSKLERGEYDAIVLAAAGINRLGLSDRITEYLPDTIMLPAAGQGALGLECRKDDDWLLELIQPLYHQASDVCIRAERAMTARLGGNCQVPIAAFAELRGGQISLRGLVGSADGQQIIRAQQEGSVETYEALGQQVAKHLLNQGAAELLANTQ